MNNIEVIQLMRTAAAIVVVLSHLINNETGFNYGFAGGFGVAFFFMICGFLLHYTNKGKCVSVKDFFSKKIIRLIPIYWMTTLAVYVLGLIKPSLLHTAESEIIYLIKAMFLVPYFTKNNTFYPLNPVGWTLIVEVFVYLVYYISMYIAEKLVDKKCIVREKYSYVASLNAIIILCICLLVGINMENSVLSIYCDYYLIYFIAGLAISIIYTKISYVLPQKQFNTVLIHIVGIILMSVMLLYSLVYEAKAYQIIICVLFFAILLYLFSKQIFPAWMLFVGKISYSLYITHYFVSKLYIRVFVKNFTSLMVWQQVIHTIIYVMISIAVATCCYYIFEKWLYNKLSRLICKKNA